MSEYLSPCPECGGKRVPAHCSRYMELNDQDVTIWTALRAVICTACGHTTFYASNPGIFAKTSSREQNIMESTS